MHDCLFETSLKTLPMHNFIKPSVATNDALDAVKKYLRSPKKEFFASNVALLKKLYEGYDKAASIDELHKLTPYWKIYSTDDAKNADLKKNDRHLSHELYDSDRAFVNAHWEAITKANGNETLYCPICGMKECEEMDHFLPREENMYPEYAAHLSNLIPLCHTCNHSKSTKFLNDKKDRIYFNAFYDTLNRWDIIEGVISVCPLDGIPQIKMLVNPTLSTTTSPDRYILSTIADLNLLHLYQDKAKIYFKREIRRLQSRVGQPWDDISSELSKEASIHAYDPDIVYPAVMKAIVQSSVMESWFSSLS